MADKITIINKQTLKDKVKGIFAIGLAGVALYTAYSSGHYFFVTKVNYDLIQEAANKGDLVLARNLLNTCEFSAKDKISLEFMIEKSAEKEKYLRSLDDHLKVLDFDSAKSVLDEAKTSKFLNREDLANLERIVYEKTEIGFLDVFNLSSEKEKFGVAKEYFKMYPEGKHKKLMMKNAIPAILSSFSSDKQNFLVHYANLVRLNLLLSEEQLLDISVPEVESIESKIDLIIAEYNDKTIKVGSPVQIVYSYIETDGYEFDYVVNRNRILHIGVVGEVVAIQEGRFYVRFSDGDFQGHWESDWDNLALFWDMFDTKDLAYYRVSELKLIDSVKLEEANSLMIELENLKQNLAKYKNAR